MDAVALLSGGLDSTTLAYKLAHEGMALRAVSFDYGQRHRRELDAARDIAGRLGIPHTVVRLELDLPGSALTDPVVPVPEGHYADESMRATVVPNRNAMMLSIAFAVAIAHRADKVAYAAHAGDHPVYPDCRPAFVSAFQAMQRVASDWQPDLHTPFIYKTKADIVHIGAELGVPFEATWSCYGGGEVHCGRCGTDVERREAFELAGIEDPTEYAGRWVATSEGEELEAVSALMNRVIATPAVQAERAARRFEDG
jgi:7-cyano-7-deazaguanine synthase